jgi:hypothetical protein
MFCSNVHWGSPLSKVFAPVGRPDKSDIPCNCSGVLIEGNRNSNDNRKYEPKQKSRINLINFTIPAASGKNIGNVILESNAKLTPEFHGIWEINGVFFRPALAIN